MYALLDFATIHKHNKYVLPNDVKQRIQMLCTSLGATPNFSILVQNKSSLQDCIREINKLTDDNKGVQIPLILDIIALNELAPFMDIFFTIIHKNSFYAPIYAELYDHLSKSSDLSCFFDAQFDRYLESIRTIRVTDQDNYDEYCKIHTQNSERRTFTLFLVHLIKRGVIHPSYYKKTVDLVFDQIDLYIDVSKEIMNELVELLFILNPAHEKIKRLSMLNPKDHYGINHKILFRFMDILNQENMQVV